MKKIQTTILLAALATAGSALAESTDPVETFLNEQFTKLEETVPGKFNINSRTRYEVFDLHNGDPANDRNGFSESVRYGYTTETLYGFNAMAEGQTVTRFGGDHNDIHPLDDDGDGTDWNQYWVGYQHEDYGKAKIGRQIYTLDNQRFIGNVGWRQNMQTFNALTGQFTGVKNLTLHSFYMNSVNRVNFDQDKMDTSGSHATYKFHEALHLTGFYYHIKSSDSPSFSNDTTGARATGSFKVDEVQFKYEASYAHQTDNSESPANFDADYYAGDLSGIYKGVTLGAGFEILESDFRTPLATVHKFNGYADVFLPVVGLPYGLEDYYAYVGYSIPVWDEKTIPVKIVYHDFSPKDGSLNYGYEIDLVASYKINTYMSLMAKYGNYQADKRFAGAGGADKQMFTFDFNFNY